MSEPSGNPQVWVVRAGNRGVLADVFEGEGFIAIGFEPAGDLTGMDRRSIFAHVRNLNMRNAGNVAGQLDRFACEMQSGHLVVTPDGQTRELLWGEVSGGYEYRAEPPIEDYRHVRQVAWRGRRSRDELPPRILYSLGSLLTVFSPAFQEELGAFLTTGQVPEPDQTAADVNQAATRTDDEDSPVAPGEQDARNREVISTHVANLDAYVTQDLVAGLLRAMGYNATRVAAPGADGGVDIQACRDPLFLQPPVVKVQVKARPDSKIAAGDVRELIGVLGADERGLFVSTGGYSSTALAEGGRHPRITLVGMEQLVELLLEHYDDLDTETRAIVPLRRIWVLDQRVESDPTEAS
jgi:restriction system protein